jgi:hypothetical protein
MAPDPKHLYGTLPVNEWVSVFTVWQLWKCRVWRSCWHHAGKLHMEIFVDIFIVTMHVVSDKKL